MLKFYNGFDALQCIEKESIDLAILDVMLPDIDGFSICLQIQCFYTLLDQLKERSIEIPKVHIQSSYGVLNYPELQCDYARIGIALYGVLSTPYETNCSLDLRAVMA